ncbi:MAG: rRNA maturation RNase YbeY [Planctomycetota bacterium]|nr:rRNA maturation RNase YbeY [Planctomycetota bacterium]
MTAAVSLSVHDTRVPGGRRRLEADLLRLGDYAAARCERPLELAFAVLDDESMQVVNRESLDHDYPTDVLSFPMADEPVLVGEVLLSADTARREAARRGHSAYHELLLYAVHGVLHLLGYEDHDPGERRRMRRAERAALAALGVPPVFGRGRAHGLSPRETSR